MLDRLERLPAPQLDALRISFGVSPGPAPSAFSSAWPGLTLLSDVADERPLICLVDDELWLARPVPGARRAVVVSGNGRSSGRPGRGRGGQGWARSPLRPNHRSHCRWTEPALPGPLGRRAREHVLPRFRRASRAGQQVSIGQNHRSRGSRPPAMVCLFPSGEGSNMGIRGSPRCPWRFGRPCRSRSPQPEADVERRRARSRQLDSGTVQLDCCRAGVAEPDPQRRAALEATRVAVLERALVHHRPALALTDSQPAGAGGRHGDCVPALDRVGRAVGVGDEGACHDGLRTRDWHGRCTRQG